MAFDHDERIVADWRAGHMLSLEAAPTMIPHIVSAEELNNVRLAGSSPTPSMKLAESEYSRAKVM